VRERGGVRDACPYSSFPVHSSLLPVVPLVRKGGKSKQINEQHMRVIAETPHPPRAVHTPRRIGEQQGGKTADVAGAREGWGGQCRTGLSEVLSMKTA
jgi:hypothetical protein